MRLACYEPYQSTLIRLVLQNRHAIDQGQYLRPSPRHLAVQKYYHPDEFAYLKTEAEKMGFSMVASGPFVRSSYHAGEDFAA